MRSRGVFSFSFLAFWVHDMHLLHQILPCQAREIPRIHVRILHTPQQQQDGKWVARWMIGAQLHVMVEESPKSVGHNITAWVIGSPSEYGVSSLLRKGPRTLQPSTETPINTNPGAARGARRRHGFGVTPGDSRSGNPFGP